MEEKNTSGSLVTPGTIIAGGAAIGLVATAIILNNKINDTLDKHDESDTKLSDVINILANENNYVSIIEKQTQQINQLTKLIEKQNKKIKELEYNHEDLTYKLQDIDDILHDMGYTTNINSKSSSYKTSKKPKSSKKKKKQKKYDSDDDMMRHIMSMQ